jgi:hypothetical protein
MCASERMTRQWKPTALLLRCLSLPTLPIHHHLKEREEGMSSNVLHIFEAM